MPSSVLPSLSSASSQRQESPATPAVPSLPDLYRALWQFAEGSRRQLVLAFTLLIGSQVFRLGVPALAGMAINTVQSEGKAGVARAAGLLMLVFASTLASWALHGPGRILERHVALAVRQRLSTDLLQRLFNAPLAWHEAGHGTETAHRVQQGTRALYDFAQSQYVYLQSAASLIGPVIALSVISAWVGAAAVTGYVVLGLVIVAFDRVLMRLAAIENAADRRYWASLSDGLTHILAIFALRMRHGVLVLIGQRLGAVFEPVRRTIVFNEAKWASVDLLNCALWIALVCLYVGLSLDRGVPGEEGLAAGIALGSLFMVYQYALQAGGVIVNIAVHFQGLSRQRTDFGSAAPIRALPLGRGPQADPLPLPQPAGGGWAALSLEQVDFVHRPAPGATQLRPATLSDVRLRLRRGRHYALIGPSGSGKTTLLRVLAGLYEPDRGLLTIDGQAPIGVESMVPWLQRTVTLMPQDAELFGGTVRENLMLAVAPSRAETVTDDGELQGALAIAQATEFIAGLRGGLDSPVAARGANLSGGQRQRLAIARALIASVETSILLLDEPTSALDPQTEAVLMQQLLASRRGATVIAAIHRPRLVTEFDEVIVVNHGRIVDQGTVDELLPRCVELQTFLGQGRRSTD